MTQESKKFVASEHDALTESKCPELNFFYKGKVRDVYQITDDTYLFVATDRISSFDKVMKNGIAGKGKILTQLSKFWFDFLEEKIGCKNHIITCDVDKMPKEVQQYKDQLHGRSMLVQKMDMLTVESIARGYLTGSGFKEYKKTGQLCGLDMPVGLVDCDKLKEVIYTPSTKEEVGTHDVNITYQAAVKKIGDEKLTAQLKKMTVACYQAALEYALEKGIIIADTKFEFGLYKNELMLGDEALTPDSSRFWNVDTYEPGHQQDSLDKQYVRNYLESINFNKDGEGVVLPDEVCNKTMDKYIEIFSILTGKAPEL